MIMLLQSIFFDHEVSTLAVGIICLGDPAEMPEKLFRIDISKLVHFEKW
jgi:hypothetical protein